MPRRTRAGTTASLRDARPVQSAGVTLTATERTARCAVRGTIGSTVETKHRVRIPFDVDCQDVLEPPGP